MRSFIAAAVLCASVVIAADSLPEKWQKRIDNADTAYAAAVKKADDARFFALQKANGERLTVLKKALTDATKAGDFDAATTLKGLAAAAEKDGVSRPKPKNVVKFGGHEYALVYDPTTWHVAKKRCEEMGGHLAIVESSEEATLLAEMSRKRGVSCWLGASDAESEGDWRWVNGSKVEVDFKHDNGADAEHCLIFYLPSNAWEDISNDSRNCYFCEWDN